MRKSILNLLGGAFFGLLTLTFTACGNIDNPLEVISNTNPATAFALKNILEKNSTFVVNFTLNDVDCTVTIVNDGDNGFVIKSFEPSENADLNLFSFRLTEDEKQVVLTCRYPEAAGDRALAAFQIFFNPQDESYYIINDIGQNTTFDGKVSVNDISGTLTNTCPDKAIIECQQYGVFYEVSGGSMHTRGAAATWNLMGNIVVYYNKEKGETWKDVVDRYSISDLDILIKNATATIDNEQYDIINVSDGYNHAGPLWYDVSEGDMTIDYYALPTHKVGLKAGADFAGPYIVRLKAIDN